jgi:uncharacterized protein YecE (DUF72 family)
MQWYAGTSGYSYKEWKGSFYPADLPNDAMLGYYAERLPSVEINNTFYRMPKRKVVANWAAAVPAHFRFAIKASRRITHQLRLKDCAEPVAILAEQLAVLEDKLGAVLFQLPPYQRHDQARLDAFLEVLPKALPSAFEFRHASWFNPTTYASLNRHGAALCLSEDDEPGQSVTSPTPAGVGDVPDPVATTGWGYLRLRKAHYDDNALAGWAARVNGADVGTAFVFFKHEDEAGGPPLAKRFLAVAQRTARVARAPRRGARKPSAGQSRTA